MSETSRQKRKALDVVDKEPSYTCSQWKRLQSVLKLGDSYQKSLIKYNEIQKSSTELKKKMDTMSIDIEEKLASVYEETKLPIDFSLFSSQKMIYGYQVTTQ
jgi:hypothetical protein